MDYNSEYVMIICNTYSYHSMSAKLIELKEQIDDKNHPISIVIDGDFARKNSDFQQCKSLYEKAYEINKENPVFNCKILEILDFLEEDELLDTTYFERIKDQKDPLSIKTKMELYIRNNDFNNYNIEYIRYKQLPSIDDRLLQYQNAVFYAVQGQYLEAYEKLKPLYEEEPYNPDVYNDLAYSMLIQEKHESAIEVLEDGLSIDDKNFNLHHLLVSATYAAKKYEVTIPHLQYCYSVNPNSLLLNMYMFLAEYFINKNYENSLTYAKKMINIKRSPETLYWIVLAYNGLKKWKQMYSIGLEMVASYPENPRSYDILSTAQLYLEFDKGEVLANMSKALSLTTTSIFEVSNVFNITTGEYLRFLKKLLTVQDVIIKRIFDDYKQYGSLSFVYAFERFTRNLEIDDLIGMVDTYCSLSDVFISFFKSLIFILRNRYKVYESSKVMETLLQHINTAEIYFELAETFIKYGDKTSAMQLLHQGRQYNVSTEDNIKLANLMVTCGYPMTATNYLKLFRDNQQENLSPKEIKKINDIRHKLFQFICQRKREPRLDKILYDSLLIQEQVQLKQDEFKHFLRRKSQTSDKIIFHNLRKWNSYTPILSKSGMDSVGGGFYLNIKGHGVVIDPGLNFVENFKNAGYSFDDIDTIIISHAHNDHTADIESILTLLYKYNSNIKDLYQLIEQQNKSRIPRKLQSHDGLKNQIYGFLESVTFTTNLQPEIAQKNLSKYIKILEFYMTKSTFKKYAGLFDLHRSSNYRIHLIEGGKEYDIVEDSNQVQLHVFNNEHKEVISDYSSIGLVLKLPNFNLVYTGDTRISDFVVQQIKTAIKKTKQSARTKQIFLCNLGGFKQYEVEYDLNGYKNIYKNHLGRIGLFVLLQEFKPVLCLISEFGEEFETQRLSITEVFDKAFPTITFFPCEIGQTLLIAETISIKTHRVLKLNKRIPEYEEQFMQLSDAHCIDDIKGNLYYIDDTILEHHLSDFIRFKSSNE